MVVSKETASQFRVGILDDSVPALRMAQSILKSALGCEVQAFEKSQDLLKSIEDTTYNLFLLDIVMPDISGLEVCRLLKENTRTKYVPIIFYSAHGSPNTRVNALKAGGFDYIDKPFYPQELVARVQNHLLLFEHNQTIALQIEELQALTRVLCHDLQNPLSVIYTMLDMQRELDEPLDKDMFAIMRNATQAGLELISHVREYRTLVDGDKPFVAQKVDVAEAVSEAIALVEHGAKKKKQRLELELQEGCFININRVVLVHNVLNNLLTNSIKFSHADQSIIVRVMREEAHCLIDIIDHGIGMPRDILEHIFDPYRSSSRYGTEDESGSGFGMPLVKRYVDKSKGEIHVESKDIEAFPNDSGTRIRLIFPLADQPL